MNPLMLIGIFIIATAVGYKLIGNVPTLLHTPLMSGMNALSGITLLGAIITMSLGIGTGARALMYGALILAMINIAGGFGVTDRMLKMFKRTDKNAEG